MVSVVEIIEARAPEYLNHTSIDVFIELATNKTNESVMGINYNEAVALRAMHMLALSDRSKGGGSSASGSIKSEKEGMLSRSYGSNSSNSNSNSNLSQTSWGVELMDLQESSIIPFTNKMMC